MKKIGITIFSSRTSFSWWSNGAHQNCVYLWMCLRAAGYDVRLYNGGDGKAPALDTMPAEVRALGFDGFRPIDAVLSDGVDLLIQAGAQVSAELVDAVRARGGRAVAFKFGSEFPIDAERTIHNLPPGGIVNGATFDEIWTTNQHTRHNASYWEILYRCPVRSLPHLWNPCFVDQVLASPDMPQITRSPNLGASVVILEPNINLIKTCHLPILIAECAYREDPTAIDAVYVTNVSEAMKSHLTFRTMVGSLDIQRRREREMRGPAISFEGRYNTPWFLRRFGDVVVSHQWIYAATYAHYDALHMGIPIVHNIPELRSVSPYFYDGYDVIAGGRALLRCARNRRDLSTHPSVRRFLASRDPLSALNVHAHRAAVERLWEAR